MSAVSLLLMCPLLPLPFLAPCDPDLLVFLQILHALLDPGSLIILIVFVHFFNPQI